GGNLILRRVGGKQLRAGPGNIAKHSLLLDGEAFHRLHQVGNQISAPLQHDIHLRPGRFHGLILGHHLVLCAHVTAKAGEHDHCNNHKNDDQGFHSNLLKQNACDYNLSTASTTTSMARRYPANTLFTSRDSAFNLRCRTSSSCCNGSGSKLSFAAMRCATSALCCGGASPMAISVCRNRARKLETESSIRWRTLASSPRTER